MSSESSTALLKNKKNKSEEGKIQLHKLATEISDAGTTGSDGESTNFECMFDMQGVLQGTSTKQSDARKRCRVSKWSEYHNSVFAELLLHQFLQGNILNGVIRRDKRAEIVAALNTKLGTSYSESIVMTRFKNMKADFRTLFQLRNRSGWGWDEQTNMLVAPDQMWNEVIQTTPKIRRFRRNSFPQYNIFEKICGDNVAIGINAHPLRFSVSRRAIQMDDLENSNDLIGVDGVMGSKGMNYIDDSSFEMSGQDNVVEQEQTRLKKVFTKKPTTLRKGKKTSKKQDEILSLLMQNTRAADEIRHILNQYSPYTMKDCITKLLAIPNISTAGILANLNAVKNCSDSKVILMKLDGDLLRGWIENNVADDPHYYASSAWV